MNDQEWKEGTLEIAVKDDKLVVIIRNGRSVGTFATDSMAVVDALIERIKSGKSELIELQEGKELAKTLGIRYA